MRFHSPFFVFIKKLSKRLEFIFKIASDYR
jgi:hypothetical protein